MSTGDDRPGRGTGAPEPTREEKLAKALRDNLRRRKAAGAAPGRRAPGPDESS